MDRSTARRRGLRIYTVVFGALWLVLVAAFLVTLVLFLVGVGH